MFVFFNQRGEERYRGSTGWRWLKILKYFIMLICLILLPINQIFYKIDDNFTPVHPTKPTPEKPQVGTPSKEVVTDKVMSGDHITNMAITSEATTRRTTVSEVVIERATFSEMRNNRATLDGVVNRRGTINAVMTNRATTSAVITGRAKLSEVVRGRTKSSSVIMDRAKLSDVVAHRAASNPVIANRATTSAVITDRATLSEVVRDRTTSGSVITNRATLSEMVTNATTSSEAITSRPVPNRLAPHKTYYRFHNPKITTVVMRHFYRQGPLDKVVTYIRQPCGIYPNYTCRPTPTETTSALTPSGTTPTGTTEGGSTIFVPTTGRPTPTTKINIRKFRTLLKTPAGMGNLAAESFTESAFRDRRNTTDHMNTDHKKDDDRTKLSDLLVMYPCCTGILIILGMEGCGFVLRDPMTKCTSLFLAFLCIDLSIVVFVISLLAILRTIHVVVVIICVLSLVFLVLEIIDAIWIYRS